MIFFVQSLAWLKRKKHQLSSQLRKCGPCFGTPCTGRRGGQWDRSVCEVCNRSWKPVEFRDGLISIFQIPVIPTSRFLPYLYICAVIYFLFFCIGTQFFLSIYLKRKFDIITANGKLVLFILSKHSHKSKNNNKKMVPLNASEACSFRCLSPASCL